MSISEYGSSGQKGFVVVPKGEGGRGWSGCAAELRRVVEYFRYPSGIGVKLGEENRKDKPKMLIGGDREVLPTYVEVLRRGDRHRESHPKPGTRMKQALNVVEETEVWRRMTSEQIRKGKAKLLETEAFAPRAKTSRSEESRGRGGVHSTSILDSCASLSGPKAGETSGPCFCVEHGGRVLRGSEFVAVGGMLRSLKKHLDLLTIEVDRALVIVGLDPILA